MNRTGPATYDQPKKKTINESEAGKSNKNQNRKESSQLRVNKKRVEVREKEPKRGSKQLRTV